MDTKRYCWISNIRRKVLAKAYRKLIVELDFKVPNTDPMKCIVKVANKANLSEKTKRQAICIMNDVTNNEISAGKDPIGYWSNSTVCIMH